MTEAHIGQRVRIIRGSHAGRTGVVTKVNGPKTVEIEINGQAGRSNFRIGSVKIVRKESAS